MYPHINRTVDNTESGSAAPAQDDPRREERLKYHERRIRADERKAATIAWEHTGSIRETARILGVPFKYAKDILTEAGLITKRKMA